MIILHPISIPWRLYLLTSICTLFVTIRFAIKITRKTMRHSIMQEVFLMTGWCSAVAMTYLFGYSFSQNGTDLTQFYLICNYLYITTSHCIKIAIALLYIKIGDIEEYKTFNRLMVPCILCSALANMIFFSLECHLSQSSQCSLKGVTYFQAITNAVLGVMLAVHPLRPLYIASRSLDRFNVILLALLFSTGLAETVCCLVRTFVTQSAVEKHRDHYLKRIQILGFWLMLETTLCIIIAVAPDIGASCLHVWTARRQGRGSHGTWQVRARSASNATQATSSTQAASGWESDEETCHEERVRKELLGAGFRWPEVRFKHSRTKDRCVQQPCDGKSNMLH